MSILQAYIDINFRSILLSPSLSRSLSLHAFSLYPSVPLAAVLMWPPLWLCHFIVRVLWPLKFIFRTIKVSCAGEKQNLHFQNESVKFVTGSNCPSMSYEILQCYFTNSSHCICTKGKQKVKRGHATATNNATLTTSNCHVRNIFWPVKLWSYGYIWFCIEITNV